MLQYPILNLYICPFQIRESTDRNRFVQYILYRGKNENSEMDDYLSFYSNIYCKRDQYDNLYEASSLMMQIVMAHYGKFVQKDIFTYMGFHKNEHDFYVFFDISNIWVNHHYLSMNDPFGQ